MGSAGKFILTSLIGRALDLMDGIVGLIMVGLMGIPITGMALVIRIA